MNKWEELLKENVSEEHKKRVMEEAVKYLPGKKSWWEKQRVFWPVYLGLGVGSLAIILFFQNTQDLLMSENVNMEVIAELEILEELDLLDSDDLDLIEGLDELDQEAKI